MSQEKVDRKKWEKANRKMLNRREKIKRRLSTGAVALVCAACIIFIGYSAYDVVTSTDEVETIEINLSSITDYQDSLSVD